MQFNISLCFENKKFPHYGGSVAQSVLDNQYISTYRLVQGVLVAVAEAI